MALTVITAVVFEGEGFGEEGDELEFPCELPPHESRKIAHKPRLTGAKNLRNTRRRVNRNIQQIAPIKGKSAKGNKRGMLKRFMPAEELGLAVLTVTVMNCVVPALIIICWGDTEHVAFWGAPLQLKFIAPKKFEPLITPKV